MSNIVKPKRIEHWHKIAFILMLYDIVAVNLSYFMALWLRFDCAVSMINPHFLNWYTKFIPISTVLCVGTFLVMRLYNSIWRFASYTELLRTIGAVAINTLLHLICMNLIFDRMPVSYYVFGSGLHLLFSLAVRFCYRVVILIRKSGRTDTGSAKTKRVMLIGAGNAGQMILRDVNRLDSSSNTQICCIIDDNSNKWGRSVEGVPVVGGRKKILSSVDKYRIDQIFIASPSASSVIP